jgi:hypothetical protein
MVLAQHAASGGGYPLIIMLLIVGWGLFALAAGAYGVQLWRRAGSGRHALWAALAGAGLAVVMALVLSPGPPVVCTYTGLSHITSAYHLAALEWQWPFPTDYPLTVPTLAAFFVLFMGRVPEALGAANLLLFALATGGIALLAGQLWRSRVAAWAGGLLTATLPLLLLFARGDVLSIGYLALSVWAVIFARRVACKEGGLWAQLGMAGATLLACQTRAEALAIWLVLAVLPMTLPRNDWRAGYKRIVPWLGGTLLLLLPHIANLFGEFAVGDRSLAAEVGFHYAWKILLTTAFLAAIVLVAGHGAVRIRKTPWWLPAGCLALLALGLVALYGWAVWGSDTHCWGFDCEAQTWRTAALWLVSPKLVPGALMFFVLAGLFSFQNEAGARTVALLVLWAGGTVAAASIKMTGELPYEGARTQLPAVASMVLLAALGVRRLVKRNRGFCVRFAAAVAGAMALTLVVPVQTVVRYGFDEQAEFAMVRSCLQELPERSLLLAPDDVLEVEMRGDSHVTRVDLYHLYRSAYLTEALGQEGKQVQVVPFSALSDAADDSRPRYWLRSLNCYRTGDGTLTPSCQQALALEGLQPICETTVENHPYTADFFEETRILGQNVVLGIYAVPGGQEEAHAVP